MTTLILCSLALFIGFGLGFYAAIKNADSSKVAKAKSIIDEIRK